MEEIRKYLNADSLHYLSQAGMVKATGLPADSFCMACYNGNYPVPFDPGWTSTSSSAATAACPSLAESPGQREGADQAALRRRGR